MNEGRTLQIVKGKFSDCYWPFIWHVYRVFEKEKELRTHTSKIVYSFAALNMICLSGIMSMDIHDQ